jgi:multidrug efflux pump subunit AcrA (membrane-fusion protein)
MFVPMVHFSQIKLGQMVQIGHTDNRSNNVSVATVSAVIPATDLRTQMFEVRASVTPSELYQWTSGQMVDVIVPIEQFETMTLVHQDAILLRDNGTFLVKVNDDWQVERIAVNIVGGMDENVAITVLSAEATLAPGMLVAVRGAEGLQTRQRVEIASR